MNIKKELRNLKRLKDTLNKVRSSYYESRMDVLDKYNLKQGDCFDLGDDLVVKIQKWTPPKSNPKETIALRFIKK